MTEDHLAIHDLVARFDDAVNRRDAREFGRLWSPDAVWEIGDPRPMRVEGGATILRTWEGMIAGTRWLFRGSFAGVVTFDRDRGVGRWPCIETGVFADGESYDNRALYEDVYVREQGRWLFAHRKYLYLWLSSETLRGDAVRLGEEIALDPA